MTVRCSSLLSASVLSVILLASCNGDGGSAGERDSVVPRQSEEAQTISPGRDAAAIQIVEPPPGSGSGAEGLKWQVPAGWEAQRPGSAMRKAQYRVPGSGGDAECVVFYFGPGEGGDPISNALRWAGEFSQPDGSSSRDALRTEQLDAVQVPTLLAEISGTYSGGMAMTDRPARNLEGYMLLGAIAQGPDANWFFKLIGPEATVREQKQAFLEMLRSLEHGS